MKKKINKETTTMKATSTRKKKHHIREGSLLWRLAQIAVCSVLGIALMIPVLLFANMTDAIADFLVGLL